MRLRLRSRSRFLLFVMIVVTAVTVLVWRGTSRASVLPVQTPPAVVVVAAPGDTLWEIALRYGPGNADPRLLVYQIRTHNRLASALLRVGQELELPPAWPAAKGPAAAMAAPR